MGLTSITIAPDQTHGHVLRELWRSRDLFLILVWRDLTVRYKQTALGLAWLFVRPLVTLLVFSTIFGVIAKLPSEGKSPYALMVFAGLLPWQFFAVAVADASSSLTNNANLISKVYFPRLLLPLTTITVAFVDFLVSFLILVAMMVVYQIAPSWHLLCLPIILFMAMGACLGPGLWLASLNVQYRDFRFITPFIVQIGLYISPVGFSSSLIPEEWRMLYSLNPMVGVIDGFRWAILGTEITVYWPGFWVSWVVILVFLLMGYRKFRKLEQNFADLI